MNRLREDDISKKEEERQREDARAARGSQREPVVVVGWSCRMAGWVVRWLVTRRPLRRYVHTKPMLHKISLNHDSALVSHYYGF